mgnify:CR=1 FL=1
MLDWLFGDKYFNNAVQVVLAHEGGLTDNPNDPGGITDYGVSLRFLRAAGIDGNMNRSDHIGPEDIKSLTPKKASNIYYKYFWLPNRFEYIKSMVLSTSMLDMAVLLGGQQACMLMQQALNKTLKESIKVDGILGFDSLSKIQKANCYQLNDKFKTECREHFYDLVKKNDKLQVFLTGWLNRINSL